MCFSILYNHGGIGSVLTYFTSIMMLESLSYLNFTENNERVINIASFVTVLLCFFLSFKYKQNYYYYLMTDINPNTIGQFSIFAFCYWSCTSREELLNNRKVMTFIMLVLTIYTQLNCESRGTLVAIGFYLVYSMIPSKILTRKFLMIMTVGIIAIGVLFPFIYLKLYREGTIIKILNKPLFTGREGLWMNALDIFGDNKLNWLFGIGSRVTLWDADTNVHNTYFGIIVNFGIVGLIAYLGYILKFLFTTYDKVEENMKVKRWIGVYLSTVLVLGFTETSIFWAVIFIFSNYSLARAYYISSECEEQV